MPRGVFDHCAVALNASHIFVAGNIFFSNININIPLVVNEDIVICGLFICNFACMRFEIVLLYGTYPLIQSHPWSFYMGIHNM